MFCTAEELVTSLNAYFGTIIITMYSKSIETHTKYRFLLQMLCLIVLIIFNSLGTSEFALVD